MLVKHLLANKTVNFNSLKPKNVPLWDYIVKSEVKSQCHIKLCVNLGFFPSKIYACKHKIDFKIIVFLTSTPSTQEF